MTGAVVTVSATKKLPQLALRHQASILQISAQLVLCPPQSAADGTLIYAAFPRNLLHGLLPEIVGNHRITLQLCQLLANYPMKPLLLYFLR
jgi:hypothetical protein